MFERPSFNWSLEDIKARGKALWNGEIPLFETFWIYYFLVVFILQILAHVTFALGDFFGLAALLWAAFMVKPILTAADRYAGDQTWALLAKVAAVIIAVAVIAELIF